MKVMVNKSEKGQVALILVLAATVAGTLVISLADRSTRNLRTQTLDTEKIKALKGAESGVEQALLSETSVEDLSFSEGVSFITDYSNEGGDGMGSDLVDPGDAIAVLVEGADSGVSSVRIYFSSESSLAALKVSEYRVDGVQYLVSSYAFDSDSGRALVNKFADLVEGPSFSFQGTTFGGRSSVGVNANTLLPPTTRLLRIEVLYSASKIGIEPIGGNLPDQQVVISSLGSYSVSGDVSVKKRLELRKEMEKVPAVFDKVLYSNSKLVQ